MHTLTGHNGGVTGISLQGNLAATSSYDSMVKFIECVKISVVGIKFTKDR